MAASTRRSQDNFNPRTPHGVRRPAERRRLLSQQISIHAPHTGCDSDIPIGHNLFNISIHAPHTGCDTKIFMRVRTICIFQSTHPTRGATIIAQIHKANFNYFNPRTPHGVRHEEIKSLLDAFVFQSTHPTRGATGRAWCHL